MSTKPRIVIAGAGSIGCFLGGLLLKGGRDVVFLARPRIVRELRQHGLRLTDYSGLNQDLAPEWLELCETPDCLAEADIVLVTVKSGATETMAREILEHARPDCVIVSLQNGVGNADALRAILPQHDVRAGTVPYNVVHMGPGLFHRGTSGDIVIGSGNPDVSDILGVENNHVATSDKMQSVLWGKLLLNLNNGLNAISDLPLKEQLEQRPWRLQMAAQISEALMVLKSAGIEPKPPTPVPAWVLPYVLRLPNPVFRAVARKMLAIDPKARSSMWEDLQQGRRTEIDEFQGQIIKLGEKHGIPVPENRRVYDEIKKREALA